MSGISRNDKVTVAGLTTSPATNVTVNADKAAIYADHSFARTNVSLADGNNTITVVARDSFGRSDTNSITCYLPSAISLAYDLNGNLRTNGTRVFDYDDDNQLIRITEPDTWKSEFAYDGKMRRRIRREYSWSAGSWTQTNEIHYVYDGDLVIQERDTNNTPLVTYTRGRDLSGTTHGVGGVGGLLARTDCGLTGLAPGLRTAFYHTDGSGNVACLVTTNQLVAAEYRYDAYGNTISMAGPLAGANLYRFSSKETHVNSGVSCFLFRYYDPNLQRWLNRDISQETGDLNAFRYAVNAPINYFDANGLDASPSDLATLQAEVDAAQKLVEQRSADVAKWEEEVARFTRYANFNWTTPGAAKTCMEDLKKISQFLDEAQASLESAQAQLRAALQRYAAAAAGGSGVVIATINFLKLPVGTAWTASAAGTTIAVTGAFAAGYGIGTLIEKPVNNGVYEMSGWFWDWYYKK